MTLPEGETRRRSQVRAAPARGAVGGGTLVAVLLALAPAARAGEVGLEATFGEDFTANPGDEVIVRNTSTAGLRITSLVLDTGGSSDVVLDPFQPSGGQPGELHDLVGSSGFSGVFDYGDCFLQTVPETRDVCRTLTLVFSDLDPGEEVLLLVDADGQLGQAAFVDPSELAGATLTAVFEGGGSTYSAVATYVDAGAVAAASIAEPFPLTGYCTAGTTTNGCTALLSGAGTPSATAANGFTITASGAEGQRNGLLFYGISGRNAAPWGMGAMASSSFLCVKSPTQRTPPGTTGGTNGLCDGTFSLDWNAYRATHPGALGAPFSAGTVVDAQFWYRDPPSPNTTHLSDGLEFVVCP